MRFPHLSDRTPFIARDTTMTDHSALPAWDSSDPLPRDASDFDIERRIQRLWLKTGEDRLASLQAARELQAATVAHADRQYEVLQEKFSLMMDAAHSHAETLEAKLAALEVSNAAERAVIDAAIAWRTIGDQQKWHSDSLPIAGAAEVLAEAVDALNAPSSEPKTTTPYHPATPLRHDWRTQAGVMELFRAIRLDDTMTDELDLAELCDAVKAATVVEHEAKLAALEAATTGRTPLAYSDPAYPDVSLVTVVWSDDDAAWVASKKNVARTFGGEVVGMGATKIAALCELANAFDAHVDTICALPATTPPEPLTRLGAHPAAAGDGVVARVTALPPGNATHAPIPALPSPLPTLD